MFQYIAVMLCVWDHTLLYVFYFYFYWCWLLSLIAIPKKMLTWAGVAQLRESLHVPDPKVLNKKFGASRELWDVHDRIHLTWLQLAVVICRMIAILGATAEVETNMFWRRGRVHFKYRAAWHAVSWLLGSWIWKLLDIACKLPSHPFLLTSLE